MITMTEKFKILAKYIKDMSSETNDVETYIFVKDNLYILNIRFRYVDGELGKKLDILQEKHSYNYFELELAIFY